MSFQTAALRCARDVASGLGRGVITGIVAVAAIVAGALLQIGIAWVVG